MPVIIHAFLALGISAFGSRFRDLGVTVRQSLDGGYVVLGTTTQGGQDIMVLTKTNKSGKIE